MGHEYNFKERKVQISQINKPLKGRTFYGKLCKIAIIYYNMHLKLILIWKVLQFSLWINQKVISLGNFLKWGGVVNASWSTVIFTKLISIKNYKILVKQK